MLHSHSQDFQFLISIILNSYQMIKTINHIQIVIIQVSSFHLTINS
jgi:hypothetical protein